MKIDDAYLDAFEADIVRLSRRVYAEVGVPMYLVPEDLTATAAETQNTKDTALGAEFTAVCAALEARNGPLTTNDIAHIMQVLADRSFLDQPFSSLTT